MEPGCLDYPFVLSLAAQLLAFIDGAGLFWINGAVLEHDRAGLPEHSCVPPQLLRRVVVFVDVAEAVAEDDQVVQGALVRLEGLHRRVVGSPVRAAFNGKWLCEPLEGTFTLVEEIHSRESTG